MTKVRDHADGNYFGQVRELDDTPELRATVQRLNDLDTIVRNLVTEVERLRERLDGKENAID